MLLKSSPFYGKVGEYCNKECIMPVFDENGRQINLDDDFPMLRDPDASKSHKPRFPFTGIPLTTIISIGAIVILIALVVLLAIKVNSLNQEVVELSKTRQQLTAAQDKLADTNAEKERLKAQLSQAKSDLQTARAEKDEAKADLEKMHTAAQAAAKKKQTPPTPAKKPAAPKKN